jgi:hypothetical protein
MLSGFISWACLLFLPNLAAGGLLPHALADYSPVPAPWNRALCWHWR